VKRCRIQLKSHNIYYIRFVIVLRIFDMLYLLTDSTKSMQTSEREKMEAKSIL